MNKISLNPILTSARRHLRKVDPVMAKLIKHSSAITLMPHNRPYYHSLVRTIINQQLSVKAGQTIEKRLLDKTGGRYFKAEHILNVKSKVLRECGLSWNKVHYIQTLAQAIFDGELNFRKLTKQDDETIRNTLMQYPGIGQWSADMFLISALRRPDIFPLGDLVLRKSIQHHYLLPKDAEHHQYTSIARTWQPYRSIASYYLWNTV